MSNDTTHSILQRAKHFLSGTLISRFSGLLRDISMAYAFGAHASVAAFMVAFRFSLLLRRLLGEGCMQAAFVPQFEDIRKETPKKAFQFFVDLAALTTAFLFVLITASTLLLFGILDFLSPDNREIVFNTLIMLPALLFICLYGINSSLLQCQNQYFLASVAPVAFNIVWTIGAFSLRGENASSSMPWLSLYIVIAAVTQWLMTAPSVIKVLKTHLGPLVNWKIHFNSPQLKQLMGPLFLGMIGVTSTQVNSAVDVLFARYADSVGPAYLWYAIRLQQLPLALFGVALSSALLPSLSRAAKAQDFKAFCQFIQECSLKCSAFILPITCAFYLLGPQMIHLLFARGDFDEKALIGTTTCLFGYSLGLLPMALVLILAPALYAKNSYKTTTIASTVSMGVNVFLNAVFVIGFKWGAPSVALATSISAFVNYGLLSYALKKQISLEPLLTTKSFALTFLVSLSAAAFSALAEYGVLGSIYSLTVIQGNATLLPFSTLILHILIPSSVFIASWAILSFMVGLDLLFWNRKNENLLANS